MDPILKYPGAKWRIAQWIIDQMPPHEGYLEPYFGSGAVFFNKAPSRVETINDADGAVVRFFKTCREKPDELAYALSLTPWSREEYLQSNFFDEQTDNVEAARQFMVRVWMAFGARTNSKTGWRHTTGKEKNSGPDNPKLWARLPEIIQQAAQRLQKAQIENKPAIELLNIYDGPELLIYADPPYLKETVTLHGDHYKKIMTDKEHEEMLAAMIKSNSMIMLSGYDSEMYQDMLSEWTMTTIKTTGEAACKRTEC